MKWENEPNELVWESHGLHCELKRGPQGAWCGYAGVKEGHLLYEKKYSEVIPELRELADREIQYVPDERIPLPVLLDALLLNEKELKMTMDRVLLVHGGVTYTGYQWKDKEYVKDLWLIGFDCAHAGDLTPKYDIGYGVYRDLEYAKKETEYLASQISALDNPAKENKNEN